MCGRYTIRRVDMLIRFGAMEQPRFEEFSETRIVPRFNVAVGQFAPIVYEKGARVRTLDTGRWSLVPPGAPAPLKLATFNAHGDRLRSSPLWRGPFDRQRCLIPADGWYEWPTIDKRKRPMFIHRTDDDVFAFAGLYSRWKPPGGDETILTYSMVTAAPDEFGRTYHHRWPVILALGDYDRWLNKEVEGDGVMDLVKAGSDTLEAYEVGPAVGVSRRENDRAELIERVRNE